MSDFNIDPSDLSQIAFGDHPDYTSIVEFEVDEFCGGYTYYYSIVVSLETGRFYKITFKSYGHDPFQDFDVEQVWPEKMTTTVWKTISEIPG